MRLILLILALAHAAAALAQTAGANLSKTPIFGLNTTAHAAQVNRIEATPDERFIVSASYDRTLRVWNAESGELVRRFTLPLANAGDGGIQALALSPDGQFAAVGGWIAAFGGNRGVAVISLADGRIVRALTGFADNTRTLAWSRDGRFLAVAVGSVPARPSAIEVYDTQTWRKVWEDRSLAAPVGKIAHRSDGRFVVSAHGWPGTSHLYLFRPKERSFERMAHRAVGARSVWHLDWTPDGKAIQVLGYWLHDGDTLAELTSQFSSRGLPTGDGMQMVRFAADGSYAAGVTWGRFSTSGVLRKWEGHSARDVTVPDPRHADLIALKSGTIVTAAFNGTLAAYDKDLKPLWRHELDRPLLRQDARLFKVSADGRWVLLPYRHEDRMANVAFNIEEPQFANPNLLDTTWNEPRTESASMRLFAWEGTGNATINDRFLPKVSPDEFSISAAVHSSEPAMVYGSSWHRLRKVRSNGSMAWNVYLGAEVVAVNLIEAKGLVVAATDNGFVRLVRWSDGAVLLSYSVQPRARKWLAVAPRGHYAASAGAEDDAGWIVNRGAGQVADFFPLSRFRSTMLLPGIARSTYREMDAPRALEAAQRARGDPGIPAAPAPVTVPAPAPIPAPSPAAPPPAAPPPVAPPPVAPPPASAAPAAVSAAAMPELPATETVAQAELPALPPVVDMLSGFEITATTNTIKLRYRLNSADGSPVTALRTRVNAANLSARGVSDAKALGVELELLVDVPSEDAEIQVFAENRHGVSAPATIRVRWAGARSEDPRGALYVVSIGVSDYDKPEYRLGFAAKDATDFVRIVSLQRGRMYRDVVVRQLTDKAASRAAVEEAFAWLKSQVRPRDTAMVFIAGHGINDPRGNYFFLPRDADIDRIEDTGVSFAVIRTTLASLPGRALMFLDTCHSGNVLGAARGPASRDNTAAINDLASAENGIVVFASSTGQQQSLENPAWGNGAFTKALVEGLEGGADLKKRGRITYKQLDAFVSDRVDELTRGRQSPVTPTLVGVPDFVLALIAR